MAGRGRHQDRLDSFTVMSWTEITSAVAVVISAASFGATRRSTRNAAVTADINRERRHADMTPQFEVSYCPREGGRAVMEIELTGPAGLDHLDAVTISIRDDRTHTATRPGGPTEEEISRQVWGPYRFNPNVDDVDPTGRAFGPITMQRGHRQTFHHLEKTPPPPWTVDSAGWEQDNYLHPTILLTITCRRDADEWTVRLPATQSGTSPESRT